MDDLHLSDGHPLTEAAAAGLWDEHRDPGVAPFHEQGRLHMRGQTAMLRAAFNAGREYEREHAAPHHDPRPWQDCDLDGIRKGDLVEARTDDILHVGVAHHQDEGGDWHTEDSHFLTFGDDWPLRRIPAPEKETAMTKTTPAIVPSEPLARTLIGVPEGYDAPHHDVKAIKAGDYVAQVDYDGFIRGGRVHHQDADGDWCTEDGRVVAWRRRRADHPDAVTVWPAPTPPAEEITLPTERPAYLTDVETVSGDRCAHMALDHNGDWVGVDQDGYLHCLAPEDITAFTLPDGTRARRDGDRFIKVQEEEK